MSRKAAPVIHLRRDLSHVRVFITGSSDGLGLMAGKLLVEQGHEVALQDP
jgi:NAD(P)-dependent dehydrogenase (short-subunit alcohol dehydrogenase family)